MSYSADDLRHYRMVFGWAGARKLVADHKVTADTYTSILTELERATAEAAANLVPRHRAGWP